MYLRIVVDRDGRTVPEHAIDLAAQRVRREVKAVLTHQLERDQRSYDLRIAIVMRGPEAEVEE